MDVDRIAQTHGEGEYFVSGDGLRAVLYVVKTILGVHCAERVRPFDSYSLADAAAGKLNLGEITLESLSHK